MDRDEFINMMIAELSKQKEEDTQAFEKPKELTPTEIFKKLCYDYPTVTNSQLALLKKHIERIAVDGNNYIVGNSSNRIINSTDSNSSIDTEFKNVFCFDPKFLENIIELTTGDSWQSVPTSNSDGISTETDPDAEPGEEEANKEEVLKNLGFLVQFAFCSL